jgi:antirestriction protein ArdC
MNRVIKLIPAFVFVAFSCVASPVLDLYDELGVGYSKDCQRKDWFGYYQPQEDRIHLRRTYDSANNFNHVALHELCHWSRAEHRLGPLGGSYKTPDCFEEVMCDLVAIVLADELGIQRIDDVDVSDYFSTQLRSKHMRTQDWQLIYKEAHKSVEYLLHRSYSKEKVKSRLVRVSSMNSKAIAQLS